MQYGDYAGLCAQPLSLPAQLMQPCTTCYKKQVVQGSFIAAYLPASSMCVK